MIKQIEIFSHCVLEYLLKDVNDFLLKIHELEENSMILEIEHSNNEGFYSVMVVYSISKYHIKNWKESND